MTKKIYDFLPGHLKNSDLETIFETTLERVFSEGQTEKVRSFVGRKEKGTYSFADSYLKYPAYSHSRDHYALEPVFANSVIGDYVFYDDLLNALYNRGSLTNDHSRLFESDTYTINLPIDIEKFSNWVMYYWVKPGFKDNIPVDADPVEVNSVITVESDNKHYVTIDRFDDNNPHNWWSDNNSWYHYEDINQWITPENSHLIEQAKRPIIEFDNSLILSPVSIAKQNDTIEVPYFNLYLDETTYSRDSTIFEYVTDPTLYPYDPELQMNPKLKSGDYIAEYVYRIDVKNDERMALTTGLFEDIFIRSEFNYRNIRQEFDSEEEKQNLNLNLVPESVDDMDVYVDGIKQVAGTYSLNGSTLTLQSPTDKYVYVDYYTTNVTVPESETHFQRLHPIFEYNIDNKNYLNVELTYSIIFDHFTRLIEVTPGMDGQANGINNFRTLGNNSNKFRVNHFGSVMIKHGVDISAGFLFSTREDFNPIEAIEYVSNAYSDYKNKIISMTIMKVSDPANAGKSATEILEMVLSDVSLNHSNIVRLFEGVDMLKFGDEFIHYEKDVINVVPGVYEQFFTFDNTLVNDSDLQVFVNGELKMIDVDYTVSPQGESVIFNSNSTYVPQAGDEIIVRLYSNSAETYIPPSAAKLGITPICSPYFMVENIFDTTQEFLICHDGSKMPLFGDLTDQVLLEFEKRIFNNLENRQTYIEYMEYNVFSDQTDNRYTVNEKDYLMYPFFKKWMDRNNIASLDTYEVQASDWRTWNYSSYFEHEIGSWRGIMKYYYGTDHYSSEPWKILKLSMPPAGFADTYGTNYKTFAFWESFISDYNLNVPNPFLDMPNPEAPGTDIPKSIEELFQLNIDTTNDFSALSKSFKFGDGSPVEMAWQRSSEYPFMMFILSILQKPFNAYDKYFHVVMEVINYLDISEGINIPERAKELEGYQFKLGSRMAGFVNNFKLFSENSSLSNSRFSEIPSDNYDLFIHKGEPNRTEFFSAIIAEKVVTKKSYPEYNIDDVAEYNKGDIVLNNFDGKYYKRRVETPTSAELLQTINFDYTAWVMISQPGLDSIGYKVYGYDEFAPYFYALDWDKTSGTKNYMTDGDLAVIPLWKENEYYRLDTYIQYNNKAYVCINAHTSENTFDVTNWKLATEWPRTNQIVVQGYNNVTTDSVTTYNYGDVLSLEEMVHLLVGYESYLNLVGWEFNDYDDNGEKITFANLIKQFLEWTSIQHMPGEFIALSPMVVSGSFNAPFGMASATNEYRKNYYRIIDRNGNKISHDIINFYVKDGELSWESQTPIYGMAIDIIDIEHAFVVDREDSYGDIIYDPFNHNRNLRLTVDCNRTIGWDGTLKADGFIVRNSRLVPNFETLVSDTLVYRDTMVDQNLEVINNLKASHIGYTPRIYLSNMGAEPETQLEFYKGFIAMKGTQQSLNALVNLYSNIKEVKHSDVWAIKDGEFGVNEVRQIAEQYVDVSKMESDPLVIKFDDINNYPMSTTSKKSDVPIKTVGYVDPTQVQYTLSNTNQLPLLSTEDVEEGDLAWIQFDSERDWDVLRLSEITEVAYIGETSDGQLYLTLTNEVDNSAPVFVRIVDEDISPNINGYYYLVYDGIETLGTSTIYKYLVFETSYEPVVVEIDISTSNSTLATSDEGTGVEAIGAVSFPILSEGDTLVVDGLSVEYTESVSVPQITIQGTQTFPFVQPGDRISISAYNQSGVLQSISTNVIFSGLFAESNLGTFIPQAGDTIIIDGNTSNPVVIEYSDISTIKVVSTVSETTNIATNSTITLDTNTVTFNDISVTGTVSNPVFSSSRSLLINGVTVAINPPSTSTETINETGVGASGVSSITLTTNMNNFAPGVITVTGGSVPSVSPSNYTLVGQTITFNTPIDDDNSGDGNITFSVEIIEKYGVDEIVSAINSSTAPVVASKVAGKLNIVTSQAVLTLSGSILSSLGIGTGSSYTNSKFKEIASDINAFSSYTSYVDGTGKLVIETANQNLSLSGTALTSLGISAGTYSSQSSPTRESVVDQINAKGFPGINASVTPTGIRITKNGQTLRIEEATTNAMSNLGFSDSSILKNSYLQIVEDINEQAFQDDPAVGTATFNALAGVVVIQSPHDSIVITNISGNALASIGISPGTYYSDVQGGSIDAYLFRDILNNTLDNILVSVTSDGRMVFNTESINISFDGTDQTVLDKIGLSRFYSSAKSNPNFKVMDWKTVRYTPGFNGNTFNEFYNSLGLNGISYIWADDYSNNRWAVLYRTEQGSLNVVARQSDRVDTTLVKRLVTTDGSGKHRFYHVYDPLLSVFPGEISKHLTYITWEDPADYDHEILSNDIWYEKHIGEIWWDTSTVRYYRYNDYGDRLGNININYVRKYWGELVPGSQIALKKWTSSTILPDYVTDYNEYTYFDIVKAKTVTKYYYWELFDSEEGADITVDDIRRMLVNNSKAFKFFPVNRNTIVTTNEKQLLTSHEPVKYELHYDTNDIKDVTHTEWTLVSEIVDNVSTADLIEYLMDNLAGCKIINQTAIGITQEMVDEGFDGFEFEIPFIPDVSAKFSIVVTINNQVVDFDKFDITNGILILDYDSEIIEGDVLRVYQVEEIQNNFFDKVAIARENFASMWDYKFQHTFIDAFAPTWREYIGLGDSIFYLKEWGITDEFLTPPDYQYLSKTKSFDMYDLYSKGVESFRIKTVDSDEYYTMFNGSLQLVHRDDSALGMRFDIRQDVSFAKQYYNNFTCVQLKELHNLLKQYASEELLKYFAIELIQYKMSEQTNPDNVVKTSYIDLIMKYRPLRQTAIYQRDSYQDMIDYVMETKPYHVKLRDVYTTYTLEDEVNANVEDTNIKNINMVYGWSQTFTYVNQDEVSVFYPLVIENFKDYLAIPNMALDHEIEIYVEKPITGLDSNADPVTITDQSGAPIKQMYKLNDDLYKIVGDDIIFNTFGWRTEQIPADGSYSAKYYIPEVGDVLQFVIRESRYEEHAIDGEANDVTPVFPEDPAFDQLPGPIEGGQFLRQFDEYTSGAYGLPEGMLDTTMRENVLIKVLNSVDSSAKFFIAYDRFGRAWQLTIEATDTLVSFDGEKVEVTDETLFPAASQVAKKLIGISNGTNIEFMLYDGRNGDILEVAERSVFGGLTYGFNNGDTVYVFETADLFTANTSPAVL